MGLLKDRWGRAADDLQLSLIDKCNLRCVCCMPAEGLDWLPRPELLTAEEAVDPEPEGITTLGGLLTLMGERHVSGRAGGLSLAEVFERCTFLLDGRAASPEAELKGRSRLDVMPPFAGG